MLKNYTNAPSDKNQVIFFKKIYTLTNPFLTYPVAIVIKQTKKRKGFFCL